MFDSSQLRSSLFPLVVIRKSEVIKSESYMQPSFFVVEAKFDDPMKHLPQALGEMYACGKLLQ
jgi:hypothetical protein